MAKEINPDSRCACGSGKKYKNCHGAAAAVSGTAKKIPKAYIGAAALALILAGIVFYKTQSKPAKTQVWSEEHGHYHDAP
jgi:hypothetical protein